eukprot:4580031-Lingulodinium_polyedra.AAC.1
MEAAPWHGPPSWRHLADFVAGGHCRPPLDQDEECRPHRCERLHFVEHKMDCGPERRKYR